MRDLAVAYRIYPGVSKSPAFFSKDKFRLAEMCLYSFHGACTGLRLKVWALLDGCPPNYEALFRETFSHNDLEIISLNSIGNYATFSQQIDLLTKQTDSDYVYFAEDDYFYFPGALVKMIDFMRNNLDADFITPYDHPDSYNTSSRFERHLVRPFGDRYWRTASSTCLTFLTSRENLVRTQARFRTYSHGNMDCPVWLALTQKFELADFRVHWHDTFRLKTWAKTWRWGYRALLFGRRYRLWTPLPALATHMESSCLSPLIDWHALILNSQHEDQPL
jgi:glycosyltransferase involved in cell wall biosynthesis